MIAEAVIDSSPDEMLALYRQRVRGTSIDGITLLSTDYFNLFNEVIMLLGLVPDLVEEVEAWRFKTYVEHFADSGLGFAHLAIEAYDHTPPESRAEFERIVGLMRMLVEDIQIALRADLDTGNEAAAMAKAAECAEELKHLIGVGSAVANGRNASLDQSAIDRLF